MQNLDILYMKIVFRDNDLSGLLYFYSIMRIKYWPSAKTLQISIIIHTMKKLLDACILIDNIIL